MRRLDQATRLTDALDTLAGNEAPRAAVFTVHALAVPVLVGGQVMAIVYGDDAERRPAAAWRESLEVLARHTGHCLEAVTVVRAAQLALRDAESLIPEDAGPTLPVDAADEARE